MIRRYQTVAMVNDLDSKYPRLAVMDEATDRSLAVDTVEAVVGSAWTFALTLMKRSGPGFRSCQRPISQERRKKLSMILKEK
jgi:hypothetical protein